MNDMQTTLESRCAWGLVLNYEQAQRSAKALRPLLMEDWYGDWWAMMEDELLLALPPSPLHARQDCPASKELEALEPQQATEKPKAKKREDNPFSVLAGLKNTKH